METLCKSKKEKQCNKWHHGAEVIGSGLAHTRGLLLKHPGCEQERSTGKVGEEPSPAALPQTPTKSDLLKVTWKPYGYPVQDNQGGKHRNIWPSGDPVRSCANGELALGRGAQ